MKQSLKTLIKILIILILYFLIQALVMTVFAAIGGMGVQGDIQGAMETYIEEKSSIILLVHNALIILCLLLYRRKSTSAKDAMPFKALSLKESAICLFSGMCFAFLISMLLSLLPIPKELMDSYSTAFAKGTSASPLELLLSAAVFAPIAEELLFRGAVYGTLKRGFRPIVAVAASCALFGLMHQDPVWIIYAFLMGIGLTLVLDIYGTLMAPIILHIAFNFTGLYIMPMTEGIPVYVIGVLAAGLGYAFARIIRHMKKYKNTPQGEKS